MKIDSVKENKRHHANSKGLFLPIPCIKIAKLMSRALECCVAQGGFVPKRTEIYRFNKHKNPSYEALIEHNNNNTYRI